MADQYVVWGAKNLNTSAQLVLAKRLGFFKQEGLDVQCKLFPTEEHLTEALKQPDNSLLAWSQTAPEILRLYARGSNITILAPLADISAAYQVVLRADARIALPGDLENHKLGIVRGSLIEVALRNMARDFGVDLDKIQFIDAPPTRQLEMFVDGEVDGIACWEPWTTQAQYVGGKLYFSGLYSMIPGHEGKVNWLTGQSLLVTHTETLRTSAALLIPLLKGMKRATDYLNATMNKAAVVLSDLLGVENEELEILLQKNLYTMKMDALFQIGLTSIRDMFPAMCPPTQNTAQPMRLVQQWPIAAMYTPDLLKQVDPTLVQVTEASPLSQQTSASADILVEGSLYYPAHTTITSPGNMPLRYVIVDDTKVVVDLFASIVELLHGTVVGTASNGAEAMIQYVDLLPDVIVMDISMPDMDGIQAIERILTINPQAQIIVISGNNYDDIREKTFALGVKVFIGKPFHVNQVVTVLSRLMRTA